MNFSPGAANRTISHMWQVVFGYAFVEDRIADQYKDEFLYSSREFLALSVRYTEVITVVMRPF